MADLHGQVRRSDEPHCYNCGGAGHWAVACPEPTRQTPAGLEAWRSSGSASGQGGGGRDHRNAHKKSKGPIITKYAPPPSATPPTGGFPKAPAYPPTPGPGPYSGHPPVPYQPHQPYPPPQYPTHAPHPPPNDHRFHYHGHPPHHGSAPPLPPLPPPQHYGTPQPYGQMPAPLPYASHGPLPHGPPPGPPPPSSLPPPPHTAGPPYPPPYGPYTPQRGPGHMQHNHRYQSQAGLPAPPPNHHNQPYRKHSVPRPPPARNSAPTPSQPTNPRPTLPQPPVMHGLPPKPPPSAHDRIEQRRDHRSKRKNDKGGRQKGPRDHQHRDVNSGKSPANKKKGQHQQGHQEHVKPPTQDSGKVESEGPREEHAIVEHRATPGAQEEDDVSESSKPEANDENRVLQTSAHGSSPGSATDHHPEDSNASNGVEQKRDAGPRVGQAGKETPSQDQEQRNATLEPAQSNENEDLVRLTDVPTSQKAAEPVEEVLLKLPNSLDTTRQEDTTISVDIAVTLGQTEGEKDFPIDKSQEESKLKRRRSNDYDRELASDYRRPHMVTESNLRSLEQSHRHEPSISVPADSAHRDHHGIMRSRRRHRSNSDNGSRRHSRGSSISSRSSGLDSLEAELLGRSSKDAMESHEKLHDKTSKAKRRRPNVDSAYSRRW